MQTDIAVSQPGEELPTVGDEPLSLEQLRWCRNEVIRLQGEATEVNQEQYWEIYAFNENIRRYRTLCSDRATVQEHADSVSIEQTTEVRQGIRNAGARRFAFSRIERSDRRIYVTAKEAKVFDSASQDSSPITLLRQWEEAFRLKGHESNRVHIEWLDSSPLTRRTGWINETNFARGNGELIRKDFCRANKGDPLDSNELVRGTPSRDRFMLLQVHNATTKDAYVKLLQSNVNVIASFVVSSDATRTINGLPRGDYEVVFVTGTEFSRGCESFINRGHAGRLKERIIYDEYSFEWAISLQAPNSAGLTSIQNMREYAEFEAL